MPKQLYSNFVLLIISFPLKGRILISPEVELYLKSNYRLTKKFCDGGNFLCDLELATQFPNHNNPTSSVKITSFQMKLGYKRMARREIDGKIVFKSLLIKFRHIKPRGGIFKGKKLRRLPVICI